MRGSSGAVRNALPKRTRLGRGDDTPATSPPATGGVPEVKPLEHFEWKEAPGAPKAQILQLLATLQKDLGLGILLITHDLGIVARVADRVSVMYAGEVVESAPTASLFAAPEHPYTRGLLTCVPVPGKVKRDEPLGSIPGVVPRIQPGFIGCGFRDRCAQATAACAGTIPRQSVADAHETLCTLPPGWRAAA